MSEMKDVESIILSIRNDAEGLKYLSKNLVGVVHALRTISDRLVNTANDLEELKNNLKNSLDR